MTTWKAIRRYSRHSNGSELGEQVIHTYPISYRSDWPRRFGEINRSPHSWIFNSVSVDSRPLSYLFTSATVPIPVHTAPEIWHFQVFKSQFPDPWISRTVISVTKRSCAAPFSSSFLHIHFCYGPNTCSHCTEVWNRTHPICDAPLSRTARRSFASLQKSPFLWVNRSLGYLVWFSCGRKSYLLSKKCEHWLSNHNNDGNGNVKNNQNNNFTCVAPCFVYFIAVTARLPCEILWCVLDK